MISRRKLEALRNLAERPGTEAEGRLAKELLDRLTAKRADSHPQDERGIWKSFEDLCGGRATTEQFVEVLRRWEQERRSDPLPTSWECACGNRLPIGVNKCPAWMRHLEIQTEIRLRFSKGDRVFYNYWAYSENTPATVAAHVKVDRENGSYPWAWISLRFDHLKRARQVPIHSAKGWHLSHQPISRDEYVRIAKEAA